MKRVLVDSDIFILDLRYSRDVRQGDNQKFIAWMAESGKAATTVFNVLETFGVITFNVNAPSPLELAKNFSARFGVKIYWPANREGELTYDFDSVLEKILTKQSLGDAQVAWVAERFRDQTSAFITWNAKHYQGKIALPVMTPAEFLNKRKKRRRAKKS